MGAFPEGPPPLGLKLALVAEILLAYTVTRWRMPRGDIRNIVSASRSRLARAPEGPEQATRETWLLAARLASAVAKTLRILPTDSRCLVQSLVLSRLLSARGIPSTLVIGAHSKPAFLAHAWVEHGGYPLLPREGFDDSRLLEL
jgi:hypothetical protein